MPTKSKETPVAPKKMIREQFGPSPSELHSVLLEAVKVLNALTGSKPVKVEKKK